MTKRLLIDKIFFFFVSNIIIFLLINPIIAEKAPYKKRKLNSGLTIRLKVSNGQKLKIINGGYIPDKIYINGNISTIDINGYVNINNEEINEVIMEYDQKKNNIDKIFQNLNSIIEADFSDLDTSQVTSMKAIFLNCQNLISVNLNNLNTSLVYNMTSLFEGCMSLKSVDLSSFNTSRVYNIDSMFKNCLSLTSLNLSNFYTPKLRKMQEMFNNCLSLKFLDISNLNTYQILNMDQLFMNCFAITSLNINNFDTKSVTSMKEMFANCIALKKIDLSNFDTSSLISMNSMFYGCKSIISLNLSNFITPKVQNMENLFYQCFALKYVDISNLNTKKAGNIKNMFSYCNSLISLDISSFDLSGKNLEYFFQDCTKLRSIKFPKNKMKINQINNMFENCYSLVNVDLSSFDFSLIQNMDSFFSNCSSLTSIDLSNINTNSLNSMSKMFFGCKSLKIIKLKNFKTSNVDYFSYLFYDCSSLISLDISSFNTSKALDMGFMFSNCKKLKSLNLSNFDTSSVQYMPSMFCGCSSLTSLNLSNFVTSMVFSMDSMFEGCSQLISLDLSNFQTPKVVYINKMFLGCTNLKYINFYNFDEKNIIVYEKIFSETTNNLIICTKNEYLKTLISELSSNKCIINDCSITFSETNRKIVNDTRKCIEDCILDNIYKYEFENFCYNKCPKGTHSNSENSFICEFNIYECFEDYPFLKIDDNTCTDECNCKDFFNHLCIINSRNNQSKLIILENIIDGIQEGIIDEVLEEILIGGEDMVNIENNTLYQITSTFNQLNKDYPKISTLNASKCENILKQKYNLSSNDILIIFKTEEYFDELLIPLINYEFFDPKTKIKLDLKHCINSNLNITIDIPVSINESILFKYEKNSSFYNDFCNIYRTDEGTDITLFDRKSEFNKNNLPLCPKYCQYNGYSYNKKKVECQCLVQNRIYFTDINFDEFLFKFALEEKKTNFEIFKCYKLLFSKKGLIKNIGNYLTIIIILLYTILGIFFYKKGFNKIYAQINEILIKKHLKKKSSDALKVDLKDETKDNTTDLMSSLKKRKISFSSKNISSKTIFDNKIELDKEKNYNNNKRNNKFGQKIINLENDISYTEQEINAISYKEALEKDKRSYFQLYLSILKQKHLLISIFGFEKEYNEFEIKICLLLFSFVLILIINAQFFNDSLMHKIYVDKGVYKINNNIPSIIYSIIIYSIIIIILKKFSFSYNYILEIKYEKNEYNIKGKALIIIKTLIIKYICFFIFGILFLFLFWYYLSSFCAVYNNTQVYLIKNCLLCCIIALLYPLLIYLVPGIFRIPALKGPGQCLYQISQIIQII